MTAAELRTNNQYLLSLWLVDKERLCNHIIVDTEVSKIDICPKPLQKDQMQFSISGKNYFRIWEYDDVNQTFEENKQIRKQLEILQNEEITDHCWLKDTATLVVVTKSLLIYVFANYELTDTYKYQLDYQTLFQKEDDKNQQYKSNNFDSPREEKINYSISCIAGTSNGFSIGLENINILSLFDLSIFLCF